MGDLTEGAVGAPDRSEFDVDTAVARVGDAWHARISDRWDVGVNPNGGYVLATIVRAMGEAVTLPDPLTVTAHYLRPPDHGDATIDCDVVRSGRRFATVSAALHQDRRERVRALATFGDLAAAEGPTRIDAAPPELPPPDQCHDVFAGRPADAAAPTLMHRFDLRVPTPLRWPRGERGGEPVLDGWIRFRDGRPPDLRSLTLLADAFPPPILDVVPASWVPTLELTVHLRARPRPGWLRAVFRTRVMRDGLLEEDGELWDDAGQLVAMSRQLALVLPAVG
jgi:acyl-CoA thioesterase